MTRLTVDGQALELDWVRSNTWRLGDADYLHMVELKTSWYSFITPLQAGAIAAGAGPERMAALEAFGRHDIDGAMAHLDPQASVTVHPLAGGRLRCIAQHRHGRLRSVVE